MMQPTSLRLSAPTTDARVALLVRGGFRNSGCVPIDVHEATLSIVTNLVRPLRSNGAHVHVFALLSKCKTCNAYEELELNHTLRLLGSELSRQRTTASGDQEPRPFSIAWQRMATLSQGHGMRAGLDAFNERRRSRDVPSEYDLVLITRIDLHIMAPLNAWWPHHAWNSSSYAFLSQCKAGNVDWERPGACLCTSDWLHAFSWRAFLAFDAVAGDTSLECFPHARGSRDAGARGHDDAVRAGYGHGCCSPLRTALGHMPIFLTEWRPKHGFGDERDRDNPVANLICRQGYRSG